MLSNGLVLNLDASDPSSYSGSGSTWNDTSGNNNHFAVTNLSAHDSNMPDSTENNLTTLKSLRKTQSFL